MALRSAGHQLLLADQNKTSRVLPVMKSDESWFAIDFESEISIMPDSLLSILNGSLQAAKLPTNYWAEVKIADSDSVVYSYLMDGDENASIIPCFGRALPPDEYTVNVKFNTKQSQAAYAIPGVAIFTMMLFGVFLFRGKATSNSTGPSVALGNYQLRKDDRKLVYKNSDMNLTEKEIELLELFSGRPNQTISRAELQHEVWESKGVVVGRSLDTYVSKLRRKLDKDNSVSITNIHGSGYKLEVRK